MVGPGRRAVLAPGVAPRCARRAASRTPQGGGRGSAARARRSAPLPATPPSGCRPGRPCWGEG
eukprot:3930632-Pleurochrysis_carterae.AAC.1